MKLKVTQLSAVILLTLSLFLTSVLAGQEQIAAPGSTGSRWLGIGNNPLPFETDQEVLAFLRHAKIVSQKELTGGINRPLKVKLQQDGVEANAIFRIVDIRLKRAKLDGRVISDFHDSFIYECAAWEMSRLLGIDNVPPCVARRFNRIDGTMQLWVEGAITEKKRRETDTKPPRQLRWMRQKQTMRLFDALISNFDRNQGNMLIDSDWKLWFIDHTRSFRKSAVIEDLDKIIWCERGIFDRLQALDRKFLFRKLRSMISGLQVKTLLKRRDELILHLNSLIDQKNETAVLWDAARPDVNSTELLHMAIDDDIPETSSIVEEP